MKRVVATVALMGALTSACIGTDSAGSDFELVEFTISGPSTIGGDSDTLSVTNSGEFPHTLVISDENGTVITGTDLIAPGQTVALDVPLQPGTYPVSYTHLTLPTIYSV